MIHIYIAQPSIFKEELVIKDKEKIHYLKDVLRIDKKEKLTVFDVQGKHYICEVKDISKWSIVLSINKEINKKMMPPLIKIGFGLIKRTHILDDLIDKLTQLGVYKIIPLVTQRVMVKWEEEKKKGRLLHWQRIAVSASQQAHRSYVPLIEGIKQMEDIIAQEEAELKLIFTLYEKGKSLKSIFVKEKEFRDILVLIGPEGDFSPSELQLAKDKGFIPVSLGELVLRTETAVLSIASFIRLYVQG
ncbi:MAG: 16S rRNA (uracil(1498)-N(3))-methyltransferase [Candidatus Omnitrophica bacterium]|nr:16S rRNA (uracil(1498)-N(3))-methyltransferase [Candidatus Omnitrophota bacterium]